MLLRIQFLLSILLIFGKLVQAGFWDDATDGVKCFFGDEDSCESTDAPAPTTAPTVAPTNVPAKPTKNDEDEDEPKPTKAPKPSKSESNPETTAPPKTTSVARTSSAEPTSTTERSSRTTEAPSSTFTTEVSAPTSNEASTEISNTEPAATSTSSQASEGSNGGTVKPGIVAAGIIVGVVVFALIGVVTSVIYRRRWREKQAAIAKAREEQMDFGKVGV